MERVRPVALATLPGLAVALLFAIFLRHRSDYLGHYLAGLGGTLGAMLVALALIPRVSFPAFAGSVALGACLTCIGLGAVMEATVFNLAKFDELDFCNQSLGAVVAALSALAAWKEKPDKATQAAGAAAALGFLVAGFHYAFAR